MERRTRQGEESEKGKRMAGAGRHDSLLPGTFLIEKFRKIQGSSSIPSCIIDPTAILSCPFEKPIETGPIYAPLQCCGDYHSGHCLLASLDHKQLCFF